MKTLRITLLLFFATLLTNCSTGNDNNTSALPPLGGTWKLVNVRGGFVGVNDSFPPGQITWTVNTANQTVTVVNNNNNPNMQEILDSGVYNYTLQADPNAICAQTFNVNNMDMGCFTVSANDLVITYEYADGFTLTFVR